MRAITAGLVHKLQILRHEPGAPLVPMARIIIPHLDLDQLLQLHLFLGHDLIFVDFRAILYMHIFDLVLLCRHVVLVNELLQIRIRDLLSVVEADVVLHVSGYHAGFTLEGVHFPSAGDSAGT